MSEGKFTPGPWEVYVGDDGENPGIEAEAFSVVVFGSDSEGVLGNTPEQAIANAHLISAAPDLLEALENLINLADMAMQDAARDGNLYDRDTALAEARAAIAKARGK